MIAKLVIRLICNTVKVLFSYHSDKHYTFEQYIDPIFKLRSFLRVKPKNRLLSTKKKKHSLTKAELDNFISTLVTIIIKTVSFI